MREVALYGTVGIVLATVTNVLHAVSQVGQHLTSRPAWQLAYVTVVIHLAPVVAAALLWSRFPRAGAWLLPASMAGSLVFGLVYHFVVPGPDNVDSLPQGAWRAPFQVSDALLLLVGGSGCLVVAWALNALSRFSSGVNAPGSRLASVAESR